MPRISTPGVCAATRTNGRRTRRIRDANRDRVFRGSHLVIHDRVDSEGYGGAPATIWSGLTAPQRRDWGRRFTAVVRRVRTRRSPPHRSRAS